METSTKMEDSGASDTHDDEKADDSDGRLEIVIDSPSCKRKSKQVIEISAKDQEIIDAVEEDLERKLEEKAAKANLSASKVKNIIKHAVQNEHLVALVRQVEDPNCVVKDLPVYEPKLTRAKAKELYPAIPWKSPKPTSEVQALITEELQEDSSGDEYVPGEESEDERDSSVYSESDPPSVGPPTPKNDCGTQTNWSEDGIFKVPQAKTVEEQIEEATIALRTRSKLCLSSTPLEKIEEAFIPPDITPEMYDMECDDEDWMDFLKEFTRPLDEVTKDDEDHDPEYNVLADEEPDKEELKEELREDNGVKVSRKELNQLIAELLDCESLVFDNLNFNMNLDADPQPQISDIENQVPTQYPIDDQQYYTIHETQVDETAAPNDVQFTEEQRLLLEQQMRQHVQMLTQNFLLSYEHPEYEELAKKCKEYLEVLRDLTVNKSRSFFYAANLHSALDLVNKWESKFKDNDIEAEDAKRHVLKMYFECKQRISNGDYTFIPTFPTLLLDTVLNSDVFLYTSMLPKIPFKPSTGGTLGFLKPETELVAIGLEQFIPFAQEDPKHVNKKGEVMISHVCSYIQRYMLPSKNISKIYKHIASQRSLNSEINPIRHYYQYNKPPTTIHYVVQLKELGTVPPNQRNLDELPYQWRTYLRPDTPAQSQNVSNVQIQLPVLNAIPLPQYNSNLLTQSVSNFYVSVLPANFSKIARPPLYNSVPKKKRRIVPNGPVKKPNPPSKRKARRKITFDQNNSTKSFSEFTSLKLATSTPINRPKRLDQYYDSPTQKTAISDSPLRKIKFNSSIFKRLTPSRRFHIAEDMLPSMPSLSTPYKTSPQRNVSPPTVDSEKSHVNIAENILTQEIVDSSKEPVISENIDHGKDEVSEDKQEGICDTKENETEIDIEKDNLDDINALMVASSTIKSTIKKKTVTVAEKKKAKQRKEITANLRMVTPEDNKEAEEKTNRYVQAYYDKLKECLDIHDYHKLMEILSNFEENKDSVCDLYYNVNEILYGKYPDLADEFLSFLTATQAKAVGKLVPYIMLNNMSIFLRKLEMYFKDQPSQAKKIYRGITELSECLDISMEKIRSTILPLLKGNKMLIDWFLQIFPCEKPPESLLNRSWESIDIQKETVSPNGELYENVIMPDVEDPYGGPNCICSCHDVEEPMFKTRTRHCIPCGTKFLQGRVFVQTGKGLRQVTVSFNDDSGVDHYSRLGCPPLAQVKRKSDISPSKNTTTAKDNHDEIRLSNDSDDDGDCSKKKLQKTKSPRKRKPKPKTEKLKKEKKEPPSRSLKVEKVNIENSEVQMNINESNIEVKNDYGNEQKHDTMEWDCNTSIESMELRISPEPSAESESGETSQDNINTDSDSSVDSQANETGNSSSDDSWTKDEDKRILETFQKEGYKEETFLHISEMLENRSISQVKNRFQMLMKLLQEMTSKS